MSTNLKPIEATDPIINNPAYAIQELAAAMTNATCLFEVIEGQLFEQVVPDHPAASRLHCALMIGIETLRQHARIAYTILDTMERAA